MKLASLLSQHWPTAKPDYVIVITPENQQISTDKLCRSKDPLIIFATRLTFYGFLDFILFHLLVVDQVPKLKGSSSRVDLALLLKYLFSLF